MTKEQLIHAMSLLNFTEISDYTIDQDYDSITMLNDLVKPTQEELDAAQALEDERIALQVEADRKAAIDLRIQALGDIPLLIGIYLEQNSANLDENGCVNIAGFSDCSRLESSFGWSFKNLSKPTIDQLETLISTKTSNELDEAWKQLRQKRDELLSACDFTQLVDAPLNEQQKTDWTTYRQSLRDLPTNTQNPTNPIWPIKPS